MVQDKVYKFSNLQVELLKIYSTDIAEDQLLEIKKLLSIYFANKSIAAMDEYLKSNNITSEMIQNQSKEHHRIEDYN